MGYSVSKDTGRIPGIIGSAGNIVTEITVGAGHCAPVARRVPPGVDTGEGGLKHTFAAHHPAPRFRHNLGSVAESFPDLASQLVGRSDDIRMVLAKRVRLTVAVPAGVAEKCRMAMAEHAARLLRVNP